MLNKIIILILLFATFSMGFWVLRGYKLEQQSRQEIKKAKAEEIKLTFIEGWTNEEMADYLNKQKLVMVKDFIAAENKITISEYPLLASKPASVDLEGFLFPDTYKIFKPKADYQDGMADDILGKMLDNFSKKFTPAMVQQAQAKNMSVYQIVTLASIIEKEAGSQAGNVAALDQQRKTIAGIFYNRLKTGMPLQSDATVNYITKKNTAAASEQDIKIDSPYNTYKYPGLPPGPICNPSLSSITAALYPQDSNYYYFLHSQSTGEIIYSKTFEEHVRNKAKYLR